MQMCLVGETASVLQEEETRGFSAAVVIKAHYPSPWALLAGADESCSTITARKTTHCQPLIQSICEPLAE